MCWEQFTISPSSGVIYVCPYQCQWLARGWRGVVKTYTLFINDVFTNKWLTKKKLLIEKNVKRSGILCEARTQLFFGNFPTWTPIFLPSSVFTLPQTMSPPTENCCAHSDQCNAEQHSEHNRTYFFVVGDGGVKTYQVVWQENNFSILTLDKNCFFFFLLSIVSSQSKINTIL